MASESIVVIFMLKNISTDGTLTIYPIERIEEDYNTF